MKCFECLVLSWVQQRVQSIVDPLLFAYQQNRGVDDALLTLLHLVQSHLDTPKSYIRLVFVNFSSAFNTIQPHLMAKKLLKMNLNPHLILWTELVQHTINTDTAQPIRLRPHRMSPAKRLVAEEKVQEMAAAGVIELSDSPWAAPVVLVQKKSREWRFCVDYRRLNSATTKDSYPLPRTDEALDHISGSSWFSSLDLRSGYWQVRLAPEAKPKTAFTIGQGLWQFRVMPFGLCNALATFERLMERVLAAVPRSRCVVYLDDLLVHASDFQQALANLTDVLAAIRQAGLRLNPKKCQLLRRETAFLGHIVSERGVATDPSKVAAVRDWPVPEGEVSLAGVSSRRRAPRPLLRLLHGTERA
ncbi:hypothetical protein SKAU_G00236350 [Synaphobranchus kaupii]|uniref:ribonuclease H n=1 Tax=Synaphobranchus kaupii TaxID=118154 RepID=A0A9Q1F6P6_SYNKA|nr:hypothetical protein SKAU_G00236350 [Synaphobranchus kaupii]